MAKSCPQNELCPTIFINLQPPPADCKSLSASGEPDVLYPVYSSHHAEPGKVKRERTSEFTAKATPQGCRSLGILPRGKDSRSLPARFTSHHGRLFLIVLWRGFPSCLKLCLPTQGRFCWTPGAVMASSLLSIRSRETSETSIFHSLFQWQYPTDCWWQGDSWDIFHCELLTAIHLLFQNIPRASV